jgi:hypothetical protein
VGGARFEPVVGSGAATKRVLWVNLILVVAAKVWKQCRALRIIGGWIAAATVATHDAMHNIADVVELVDTLS